MKVIILGTKKRITEYEKKNSLEIYNNVIQ